MFTLFTPRVVDSDSPSQSTSSVAFYLTPILPN